MNFSWKDSSLGSKLILVSSCVAFVSTFLSWTELGVLTQNDWQHGMVLFLLPYIYPFICVMKNIRMNPDAGLISSVIPIIAIPVYMVFLSYNAKAFPLSALNVMGIGFILFSLASIAFIIGVFLDVFSKEHEAEDANLLYDEQKMKLLKNYTGGLLTMAQFNEERAKIEKLKHKENLTNILKRRPIIIGFACIVIIFVLLVGYSMYDDNLKNNKSLQEMLSSAPEWNRTETRSSQSSGSTYQEIFDEYSQKIRAATPRLINEYKAEAAQNRRGIEGLAEISNAKIQELAGISSEGTSKMAEMALFSGMGSYMEWAMKLNSVYMEEAGKITSAYMSSAAGSIFK